MCVFAGIFNECMVPVDQDQWGMCGRWNSSFQLLLFQFDLILWAIANYSEAVAHSFLHANSATSIMTQKISGYTREVLSN